MAEIEVHIIGIDLDGHDGLKLLRTYFNAKQYGKVTTYYTKHGFHLVIELNNPVARWKSLDIRALLNDDPERIYRDELDLDSENYHRFDRLFDIRYKKGKKYRRWEFKCLY